MSVSAIAHRYGLKPQISEMLMDIEIDHADQTEESDMSSLRAWRKCWAQSPR
ncbi:gene late control D domain protein [Escherichia coli EPEC C342-62]|nr:gene late control D domain protein [Escherichia coli EPEC C342-62]